MFVHRQIASAAAAANWEVLQRTVSSSRAFQTTETIGELAANDMLEFCSKQADEVDRVYVKLRDGMPMASGMKRALPNADFEYVISQEKQGHGNQIPISFWEGYDGYSSETVWFADPMNATGHTAIESLRFLRQHFSFTTALVSHVAANIMGIHNVQAILDDYYVKGYMNYAHLSRRLGPEGYMEDGLALTPDFGDKAFGTLGEDYSVFDIRDKLRKLLDTSIGGVELVKGSILYLLQLMNREEYRGDRSKSWTTRNWINSALAWYKTVKKVDIRVPHGGDVKPILSDLLLSDFVTVERRPWKSGYAQIYSLTEDGRKYAVDIYLPLLDEHGLASAIAKDFYLLMHRTSLEIDKIVLDSSRR